MRLRFRTVLPIGVLGLAPLAFLASAGTRQDLAASPGAIRSLIDAGHYAEAESTAWIRLSGSEPKPGADSLNYGRAIDLLVESRIMNGHQYRPRTRELADLAIGISERHVPPAPTELAHALQLRASLCEDNESAEGLRMLERARGLLAGHSAVDSLLLARVLDDLGEDYADEPRLAAADSVVRIAAAIQERLLPPDHPDRALSLLVQSLPEWSRGHQAEAIALMEKSAAMMERCLGPEHPRLARVLRVLATRQRLMFDVERAQHTFDRAIAIDEHSLRPDHPHLARALASSASNLEDLGKFEEARVLCERALAIRRRELPPDHPDIASSMFALGENCLRRGDVGPGCTLLEGALALQRRVLPPGDFRIAVSMRVLGSAMLQRGELRAGLDMMVEGEAITRKYYVEDTPEMVWATYNIAEAEVANGEFHKAADLVRSELPHAQRAGKNGFLTLVTLNMLATAEAGQGHWQEARNDWARVLDLWRPLDSRNTGTLGITTDLARAEAMLGHRDRALALLRDLAASPDSVLNPSRWSLGYAKLLLSDLLRQKGELGAGLREALSSVTLTRDLVRDNLEYLSEDQGFRLLDLSTCALGLALGIAAEMPSLAPDLASATYDAVIRSRAAVLDAASRRAARSRQRLGPEAAAVESSLAAAGQRVANLEVRVASEPSPAGVQLLESARREKQSLESKLVGLGSIAEATRRDARLAEITAARPESTALVSIASYERIRAAEERPPYVGITSFHHRPFRAAYVAFVLRSGADVPEIVPLGPAARVDSLVERYVQAVSRPPTGMHEKGARTLSERAQGSELRHAIWDPIRRRIGGAKRAFIVLDGALMALNITALPDREHGYVVEHGPTLHYLSAERDLVALSAGQSNGHGLLAVGDPDFDFFLNRAVESPFNASRPARRAAGVDCEAFGDVRFSALPAARQEIETIASLWTHSNDNADHGSIDFLSGQAASEAAFKREAPGHRILHLATHGFFYTGGCAADWPGLRGIGRLTPMVSTHAVPSPESARVDESPLLLSGLALAGANRRGQVALNQEDGILTSEEIAALDLSSVEWAVVSACESGAGAIQNGEGVMGLRRALQEAGVRTNILSLWPVKDRSARNWMKALYESRLLRRLDTAESVRAASLQVLADRRRHGLSTHPFYWGGFVACGDWR